MLTPFDDYPIHQTPLPVAHPASGDPNHYDRYFFNALTADRYVGVAMGCYPNRGVVDAAVSVVAGGLQRSVFASARAPLDRAETRVGPIAIEIVEPLRTVRVTVDDVDAGLVADCTFTARTPAVEEPRQTLHQGTRLLMDSTRMTQWGTWAGTVETTEGMHVLDGDVGTKDRSWGVRPVGEPVPAAPDANLPAVFFLWAPIHFEDCVTHALCFERPDGSRIVDSAAIVPVLDGPDDPTYGPDTGVEPLAGFDHALRWAPGRRRSGGPTALTLRAAGGGTHDLVLEPLVTFRMRGIGYTHPVWGHGRWQGELAVGSEVHPVDDLDDLDPANIHVQQVVRARWGDRTGLGVLEQLCFGPHAPTGLREFLDGGPDT